jgi:hypothetical protein
LQGGRKKPNSTQPQLFNVENLDSSIKHSKEGEYQHFGKKLSSDLLLYGGKSTNRVAKQDSEGFG